MSSNQLDISYKLGPGHLIRYITKVVTTRWEHFVHAADIGVRGMGREMADAFTGAALALTAVITDPQNVAPKDMILVHCEAPDHELLLVDWLNALVYEMATRDMLFSNFDVDIRDTTLNAHCWGERIDEQRHHPTVEVKGATYTELSVQKVNNEWIAQTVVDV